MSTETFIFNPNGDNRLEYDGGDNEGEPHPYQSVQTMPECHAAAIYK